MAVNTPDAAVAHRPDLIASFDATAELQDALILNYSTVAGSLAGDAPAVRVPVVTDGSATYTAEGAEIPESNAGLAEELVYSCRITQRMKVSREMLEHPKVDKRLADSCRRSVTFKANQAFLTQVAPTSPAVAPSAGVLVAAKADATAINGGAVASNLDALVDLLSELETKDAQPSVILLAPDAWATLRKLKTTATSNQPLLGAGTRDVERRLLDVPVVVSNHIPTGEGLVIDKSAVVSAVGSLDIARSEHVHFTSDSVALRAIWRIGFTLVSPEKLGYFTVTA